MNRRLTQEERQRFSEYVRYEREHNEQYHARKELRAWVAVTVYLGGLVALASGLFTENGSLCIESWGRCALSIGLGVMFLLTGLFVSRQFTDRRIASRTVGACAEILAAIADPNFPLYLQDLELITHFTGRHTILVPTILSQFISARPAPTVASPVQYSGNANDFLLHRVVRWFYRYRIIREIDRFARSFYHVPDWYLYAPIAGMAIVTVYAIVLVWNLPLLPC